MEVATAGGWRALLAPFDRQTPPPVSLHLAVLVEPYLGFLLEGRKTVESRFSVRATPPYGCVNSRDVVLVKKSGGPIVGAFTAASVWYYRLDPASWDDVRQDFAAGLCAQDGFWEERAAASFATMMRIADVRRLPAVKVPKRDRRGWVVLSDRRQPERLLW